MFGKKIGQGAGDSCALRVIIDDVKKFDEELFRMMVERIRLINLIQVEFVVWSGVIDYRKYLIKGL